MKKTARSGTAPGSTSAGLSRRSILKAGGALALTGLAGCTEVMSTRRFGAQTAGMFRMGGPELPPGDTSYAEVYGPEEDDGFEIPAVPYHKIEPRLYRQVVADPTGEKPGTIVVNTQEKMLYFTQPDGQAIRYGVGVGREGFSWSGRGQVQWKQKWPKWTPPGEMIDRQPELAKYSARHGGMDPGLMNPLGARAMYIFHGGKDTLYRIHGSPEWWSIGKAVSSGCIRMINQDVIDLYARVPVHTPVLVI